MGAHRELKMIAGRSPAGSTRGSILVASSRSADASTRYAAGIPERSPIFSTAAMHSSLSGSTERKFAVAPLEAPQARARPEAKSRGLRNPRAATTRLLAAARQSPHPRHADGSARARCARCPSPEPSSLSGPRHSIGWVSNISSPSAKVTQGCASRYAGSVAATTYRRASPRGREPHRRAAGCRPNTHSQGTRTEC